MEMKEGGSKALPRRAGSTILSLQEGSPARARRMCTRPPGFPAVPPTFGLPGSEGTMAFDRPALCRSNTSACAWSE